MRHLTIAVVSLLTLSCADGRSLPNGGAVVATGRGGLKITADELRARLEEQPPFVRAGYGALERKKELLDSVVRFEVLAQEAQRQGLDQDPEVIRATRKVMVQKLMQARQQAGVPPLSEAELSRYYEDHRAEYLQLPRVGLQVLVFSQRAGEQAARALAQVRAGQPFEAAMDEFKGVAIARDEPELQTREELSGRYGPRAAEALLALGQAQVSEVLETPEGLVIARITGVQAATPRPFEQVRAQIENKLQREQRARAFEAWVAALKESAAVSVDERALEGVQLAQ